jgi:hypothetical protein
MVVTQTRAMLRVWDSLTLIRWDGYDRNQISTLLPHLMSRSSSLRDYEHCLVIRRTGREMTESETSAATVRPRSKRPQNQLGETNEDRLEQLRTRKHNPGLDTPGVVLERRACIEITILGIRRELYAVKTSPD